MVPIMLMAALLAAPAQTAPAQGQAASAQGQAAPAGDVRRGQSQDAQDDGDRPVPAPKRVRDVLLFGNEPCPKSTDTSEIVVCTHAGESPYRIPKRFREQPFNPANESWVRRVEVIEDANHATLPNSCSPVGDNGQTGCTSRMLEQWRLERQAQAQADSAIP